MSTGNGIAARPPGEYVYLTADQRIGDNELPLRLAARMDGKVEFDVGDESTVLSQDELGELIDLLSLIRSAHDAD